MKIKVLLVDDHALFRDGMRYVLQQLADEVEILDTGNFTEALQLVMANPDLDLALLDLHMPDSNGVPSLQLFHQRFPSVPLVVVSGSDHRDDIESVVKDLSLEIPNAPAIFLQRENPQIDLQLQTKAAQLEEGVFEVEVTVTVTAKVTEKEQVMFLIEAKQAGIFQVRNMPAGEMEGILAVMCPNILYPYLREVVSDVAVRGGFAPVLLNPINFEAIYQQQKQQAQAQAEGAAVKH